MGFYFIETAPSSREPVISSRPGTGTEMLKVENQARNSHGLSIVCLLKDHHASRDRLWMLKSCPCSECYGRVCGFACFIFSESKHKSAGSTRKTLSGIELQKSPFLAAFHFVHSHVGRRTLQPTGFARLHAVSPQILQTKKV